MSVDWNFPKIFYGWWIVGAAFVIALYMNSVVIYGFTAIFEPITDEFGWTHAQVSFAASLRGVEEGFFVLAIGMLVDRWGPRRFLFGGAIVTALGFIVLGNISSLAAFYGAYTLIGLGRGLISGTVLVTAVVNWFRTRAGLATALALSGFTAGGMLAPIIVKVVDGYGWRESSTIFGAVLLVIFLPLSLVFRHKPEPYGYSPDGKENSTPLKPVFEDLKPSEIDITLKKAVSSRIFWQIALAYMLLFTVILGFLAHVLPYLSSIGIERSATGFLVMIISVSGIIGRIVFGFAVDKFNKQKIAAVPFIGMTIAMLCIGFSSTVGIGLVIIGLILFGSSWGCNSVLRVALVREFFGRKKFGSILGLMTGIGIIIAMSGPPVAGWVFDNWQNYQGAWLLFAGLALLSVISILTISKSSKPAIL